MAINTFQTLIINNRVVAREGDIEIDPGAYEIEAHPQVGGPVQYTTTNKNAYSKIMIPSRVLPQTNDYFDSLVANGDNNTIIVDTQRFVRCVLQTIGSRKWQQEKVYTFFAEPLLQNR